MAVHVHRHEGRQLQQPRIDAASDASILEADPLAHRLLELAHGHAAPEIGHVGRCRVGVDRPPDKGQRARLRIGILLREIGGRGQRQRRRLADRDDMRVWPEVAHEVREVEGVVLDVELARRDRYVSRVVPVGDIDLAVGYEGLDGRTEERRVMPRHGRHEEDLARLRLASRHLEVQEIAERLLHFGADVDEMIAPVVAGQRVDAPVGLGDHALEAAFRHLAPGCHPADRGVRKRGHVRVGAQRAGRGPEPLARVSHGLHQVVGHHVAHDLRLLSPKRGAHQRDRFTLHALGE